jgi:N-hydroxyarylamine O-acetyltransferase
MDAGAQKAYLERIGAERPEKATSDALRALHAAHILAVPFENLSIHLGEPILLDEAALFDKIVTRRRGGFCYELNGAFASLLTSLGFDVALHAACVFGPNGLGPPFDHLAVTVSTTEHWIVDVGFGAHTLHPLRLDDDRPQNDPFGTFVVSRAEHGDVDVSMGGAPQYRMETRERRLDDFGPTCWWQQTSPDSHFTQSLTCSLPTETTRVTISDRRVIVTTPDGRDETTLETEAELLAAYRDHFGIVLDRAPHLSDRA